MTDNRFLLADFIGRQKIGQLYRSSDIPFMLVEWRMAADYGTRASEHTCDRSTQRHTQTDNKTSPNCRTTHYKNNICFSLL